MSKTHVDLAVSARWIIPVIPAKRTLENCTLVVNQGTIVEIVPTAEYARRYTADQLIELNDQLLIPGLINAHGHAAMSLLRGFADDYSLQTWLEEHIWPTEQKWVDEQFVRDGTELAIAEMLLSGTTCFADMYFFPEAAADVVHQSGMRAQIAFPVMEFPSAWGAGPDEYIEKGLKLNDDYRSHDRINIAFGPHAPYTVSDKSFSRIVTLAAELQAPIHLHLHETAFEVDSAVAESNKRPIARMAELGVLSPLTQCVHMTQINSDDIEQIQASGAHVVHCPNSNMKLASGLCPTQTLIDADINIAIGTDGAASNNNINMLEELKQAALLGKLASGDAAAISAAKALEMATLGGARALGIDDKTGSLEEGKLADFCAIQFCSFASQPLHNPLSQLVYANRGASVTNVWVGGNQLVEQGELTTLNAQRISKQAGAWREKLHNAK